MYRIISTVAFLLFVILLTSCRQERAQKQDYNDQIGDTPYNINIDSDNFKFCDSTNVLHKRALVRYKGGTRALEEEVIENYNFDPKHQSYTGYFIIRFAVNCNDEAGRFRIATLDSKFNPSECPDELEEHILSIVKGLKDWEHAFYKGKDYDCYRFINIKMVNGQIERI